MINQQTDQDFLVPACKFTSKQRRLLNYNLPPLEPLAIYARNQCKFLEIVEKLEVRKDVVLDDVTVWRDHDGVIQYYFDAHEAARWIDFIQEKGRHSKAEWRGQPLILSHWQVWQTMELFGWREIGTALRRYKYLFEFVPRKNGKTLWLAAVALGVLLIDGEMAPEIYCMGSAKDQSDTLYAMAQCMCGTDEKKKPFPWADTELTELTEVGAKAITCEFNGGSFQPLPFNADAFHGKNPHLAIVEEYHAHKNDTMRDVGEGGQGVRGQSLVIIDTTAGENPDSPCFEELLIARNVRDGALVVPNYLPVIFEAGEDDPWDSLATAAKCNPQFGLSLKPKFFIDQIQQCKIKPHKKRTYKQQNLNQFVGAREAAFDFDEWIKNSKPFDVRDFKNMKMYAGMDLASVNDLTALVGVFCPDGFDGIWYAHAHFWCPENAVTTKKTVGNYDLWKEQGYLVATPGNATDYDYVVETIKAYDKMFDIDLLNCDRYNAMQLAAKLTLVDGLRIEFIGQGSATMTEPIKELQRRVKDNRIVFCNPILDWMAKTVVLTGNDRACAFGKLSDASKIDGMVALAMAIAAVLRAMNNEAAGPEERGFYIV